ncbi:RNA recognition motif domain-containing protein [Ditylenchus destructor]|nr:RNA recognition motif domain-containing protein [Ditylenchus destructor]
MISHFRHIRTYFHQLSNTRRQLCDFTLTVPTQSNVNHEEKLLSAVNHRHLTSQFYILQNFFSSSSGSRKFDHARTLMVAGLSRDTTDVALCVCFSKKWEVTYCRIVRDKMTGNSRRFGFVELLTAEQAKDALEFDHFIDGKQIRVQISGNKELDEKYKIFVGGLLKETSEESLHKHFSKFGDIFACDIVRSEDNLSKGFGFVVYKSQDSLDCALNSQPHWVDNTVVTVKHASPRRRELTLFVGNLSPQTTSDSLGKHFSKYGQLTQCNVKTDPNTGQSRGFGHVTFESQEEFERARSDYHIIDGVKVSFHSKGQDLVVESLSPNITEDSLRKFFSQYGQVQDCAITKNSVGASTAFVTMSNEEEISRALNARPHWIDGKLVDTHQKNESFNLFVGGLPKNTTDEDLYETFSKVGNLVHWEVKRDWKNKTNRPLGYAYVAFSSAEEVDRVMEDRPYYIHGSELTVQRRLQRKKQ